MSLLWKGDTRKKRQVTESYARAQNRCGLGEKALIKTRRVIKIYKRYEVELSSKQNTVDELKNSGTQSLEIFVELELRHNAYLSVRYGGTPENGMELQDIGMLRCTV